MTNRGDRPIEAPSSRRIWAHRAWKVPILTFRPSSAPTRATIRSRISPAALFVNVTARIRHGATFRTPTRWATRWATTRVLPDPAPARMRSGPSVVVTARACSGLRRARIRASSSARSSDAGREAAVALRRPGVLAGRAPRLVVEDRRFGEGRLGWVGAGRLAGGREPGWRCGGRVGQGRFGLLEPGRGGIHVAIVPAAASPPLHGWRSGAGTTATGAASPMTLSRRGCRPARRSPRRAAARRS